MYIMYAETESQYNIVIGSKASAPKITELLGTGQDSAYACIAVMIVAYSYLCIYNFNVNYR